MLKFGRILAPLLLGAVALAVMLSSIENRPLSHLATTDLAAQVAPLEQGALPAERAEMYQNLLRKSLRTKPYLAAPSEKTVARQLIPHLGHDPSQAEIQAAVDDYYTNFHRTNNKVSRPNPMAYLGRLKAQEMAAAAGGQAIAALEGSPEVLTVMLNFTGVETYTTDHAAAFGTHCLTDTTFFPADFKVVIDGPRFNEIAQPDDNNAIWLDPATSPTGGFTQEFFDLLMYSTEGYTARMRPELPNPWDGGSGFTFAGSTFRNYYLENSRGIYIPQGEVVEVDIPKAVSYFGAAVCDSFYQDDSFNERPGYTIAISTAQQINAEYPGAATAGNSEFSWADWDKEDVIDYDNDGNFFEPDGYVDHFFLIEAGQSEEGVYEEFLIWPHSSDVNPSAPGVGPAGNQLGGYQVAVDGAHPLGGVWILNYTISDENGGLGVLVHEYGHDIGLPDNYALDDSGPNPGFWDVMASGVFGGALPGMQPIHMTIWDKEFLGWNEPVEIDLVDTASLDAANGVDFTIGQQSKPPTGTIDGLRINLPDIASFSIVEPFDSNMWWSDKGDDRNESIARTFTLQAGESATITAKMAYFIEVDYDYLFWEISSTVTGAWVPLDVYSGTTEITTDEDPNGGNPSGNGINGFSGGDWIDASATITPGMHAGGEVALRFRYFTDAGFQEEGVFLDNINLSGSMSGDIFSDDAEGGDAWTHLSEGINKSKPWILYDGVTINSHYYLVEWRNSGEKTGAYGNANMAEAFETAGFDIGLNRMYWISQLNDEGNISKIDPFFMHTPGMLIWYVNNSFGDNNLFSYILAPPSEGAKGHVLLVDANPYPVMVNDPAEGPLPIWERRSAFDGAYTLEDRPAFVLTSDISPTGTLSETLIPGGRAKPAFYDRIGVAPGIYGVPPDDAFYFDPSAGVVLPSANNMPYWAAWDFFGETGNPGLEAFGINLEVLEQADDGTWGKVRFWLDDDTIFVDKYANVESASAGDIVTYTITLKDASGTRYADDHNYTYTARLVDHLPPGASYVPNSLSYSEGPWTTQPSTATVAGDTLTWDGVLGGNPLHISDAVIQYAVNVNIASGTLASTASLFVNPILIDTDTFSNTLLFPYFWPKQELYVASSEVPVGVGQEGEIYLPIIRDSPEVATPSQP